MKEVVSSSWERSLNSRASSRAQLTVKLYNEKKRLQYLGETEKKRPLQSGAQSPSYLSLGPKRSSIFKVPLELRRIWRDFPHFSPQKDILQGDKKISLTSRVTCAREEAKRAPRAAAALEKDFLKDLDNIYRCVRRALFLTSKRGRRLSLSLSLSLPVRSARLLRKKREKGTQHFGYTNGALLNERTRKDTMMYDEA